jgi:hypothetical protein
MAGIESLSLNLPIPLRFAFGIGVSTIKENIFTKYQNKIICLKYPRVANAKGSSICITIASNIQ